jgi:RecG-like helicase
MTTAKLFLSIKPQQVKDTLIMFRKTGTTKDTVSNCKIETDEIIRKSEIVFTSYTDHQGTEEFLTLTVEDEDTSKKYTFLTTPAQIKQICEVHNAFLETGEFVNIDYPLKSNNNDNRKPAKGIREPYL